MLKDLTTTPVAVAAPGNSAFIFNNSNVTLFWGRKADSCDIPLAPNSAYETPGKLETSSLWVKCESGSVTVPVEVY